MTRTSTTEHAVDRDPDLPADLPAPRPLDAALVGRRRHAALLQPGVERRRPLRHPGGVRPGRRRACSTTPPSSRWPARPRALNTIGGQVTWQATAFGAIVAGLMSMFLVGRHTRAEEESGRDELRPRRSRRPVRADDGGPRDRPCRPTCCSASWSRSAWSPTRSRPWTPWRSAWASPCAAGSSRVPRSSPPSSPPAPARCTASPGPSSASPTRCAPSATWATPCSPGCPRSGGTRHARLLRACAGGRCCCSSPPRRPPRRRRTPCSRAATSAPACSPTGPDPPGPARAWAVVSGSPGGSSAARSSGWAVGLFFLGVAYGSIGDDVGELVGDSGRPARCSPRAAPGWSTASTPRLMLMLALIGVRVRDLLGAAPAGRGGRGPRRDAAGDRAAARHGGCSVTRR